MVKKTKAAKKHVVAKKAKPRVLPKKMSALIRISLADIRKAERQPKKFIVEMSDWLSHTEVECTMGSTVIETYKVCALCAAGSVMAFSLDGLKTNKDYEPHNFPENQQQLYAINNLRTGNVQSAWRDLNSSAGYDNFEEYLAAAEPAGRFDTTIPEYNRLNPEPFHKAMTKLQQKLQKAGH
jgi:hypothetical protein